MDLLEFIRSVGLEFLLGFFLWGGCGLCVGGFSTKQGLKSGARLWWVALAPTNTLLYARYDKARARSYDKNQCSCGYHLAPFSCLAGSMLESNFL